MLHQAKQLSASFHAELYKLIPEDHILRKIHAVVDFSFIQDLVRGSYCEYYGRPANEPELLFRLSFLQIMYNLSDLRVIQDTQVNLAYKWFVGLNPEDPLPDPSQLSRFRNHRLGAGQVDEILKAVVRQCISNGLISSKTLLVDGTHTLANAQKQTPLEVLQDAAKRLFRVVVKKHPKLETKLPQQPKLEKATPDKEKIMLHYLAILGETVESLLPEQPSASISEKIKIAKQIIEDERLLSQKGILSAIDPDARFGWKSSVKSFFGYKEHIAMTEEEIITAIEVTGGSEDEGKQLGTLLAKSRDAGIEINEVIGDTAYSGKDNLAAMKQDCIQPIVPLNPIVHEGGPKQEGFEYNKDAGFVVCPAGEHSVRKAIQGSKKSGHSRSLVFFFDVAKCKTCPLREDCYKSDSRSKTYSIRIVADHYQEQLALEATDHFKTRIKRRPIIEHKNAELKRYHGLTRAKYSGLVRLRLQAILTAFVVNAKRMTKLINAKMQPA